MTPSLIAVELAAPVPLPFVAISPTFVPVTRFIPLLTFTVEPFVPTKTEVDALVPAVVFNTV